MLCIRLRAVRSKKVRISGAYFFGVFMRLIKKFFLYFSKFELTLWLSSLALIILSFVIFDRENYFSFVSSLIGATALIFCAKGNPFGQVLIIIFGLLYGIISFSFRYYGEMITYVGMTVPMAILSLVTWLKNPYKGNRAEVKVNKIKKKELVLLFFLALAVTFSFYFILKYFNTANLIVSTVSVATSFIAAFLTMRRSPFFALAYAVNDVVLIVLWIMATIVDISYLSVIICFSVFLFNDLYGFFNWLRMRNRQKT